MNPNNFVFFLPRTDDAAGKKTILLIEKASENDSLILTELGSVRRAVSMIQDIRATAPGKVIAVDTACSVGRDLLCRSRSSLKFNERGYDPLFFLSQLFFLVRDWMPAHAQVRDSSFTKPVIDLLHTARSNGGRRPCMISDLLIAEIGTRLSRDDLPQNLAEQLTKHPLGQVLRYFADTSRRILGDRVRSDPVHVKRILLRLATTLASLHQSAFPFCDDHWMSPGIIPEDRADRIRQVDNFIFDVLEGSTHTRKSLRKSQTIPSRVVRITDEFLTAIDLRAVPVFHEPAGSNRYERIRGFLALIFNTWTLSLYADCVTKPQIVDLSLLRSPAREEFQRTILDPLF